MNMPLLRIESLTLSIDDRVLCQDLNLELEHGQSWGLLGRNGAGKTTLLHGLIGLRAIDSGSISIDGKNIDTLSRRELAMQVGILFQEGVGDIPATVLETVLLGRHPHVQSLLRDEAADVEIARQSLEDVGLTSFADRQIGTLSGGERQRLAIAMLIAQSPDLYLLDEPSNHLDIAYQVSLLSRLRKKMETDSSSLLMASHDINLASRFCDNIVLMMEDGSHLKGPKQELLNEDNLSRAYGCPIRAITSEQITLFYPA